jgi:hypothetical protein
MAFKKKTVAAQVDETVKTKAVEVASKLTLDGVLGSIAKTAGGVQKVLGDLGTELSNQLSTLETVQTAVKAQEEKLQTLYGIEAAAASLEEIQAKVVTADVDYNTRVTELEATYADLITQKEKSRKREEDEFNYNLGVRRRKEQAEYETAFNKRVLELNARETALAERETKVGELEKQVAAFPEVLKKEVNAAVIIATNSQKKDYMTEKTIAQAQADTAQQLAAQRISALEAQLKAKDIEIVSLKEEVVKARKDGNEVALKALESASGRSALEAIQSSNRQSDVVPAGRGR